MPTASGASRASPKAFASAVIARQQQAAVFAKCGCLAAESERIARYLVAANLTGHDSHGVVRVPRYVDLIQEGAVVRDQTVEVPFENDSMAVVDARRGLGQTVGPQAVAIGIRKAKANGVAVVALHNAGHIGRVGDWAETAAAEGPISIHFVNGHGSILVAPFGGADRRFSTAPFCVGVPRKGKPPVVLDFATSLVAEGKVLVASNGGKTVPDDAMIGPDGSLTGDPAMLYGPNEGTLRRDSRFGLGAIRAFGEHKGSGLALMCELLGGALTGNGTAGPIPEGPKDKMRRMRNGMLSIYLAPHFFGSDAEFDAATATYLDFVKSAKPAKAGGEVLVPGEPEQRNRADRTANGVPMPRTIWESILAAATKLGVPAPAV